MASLTRDEASARSALLDVAHYDVDLDLTGLLTGTTLRAVSTIRFTARGEGVTFADVVADAATARLDGTPLPDGAFDGERLSFSVTPGEHELVVESRTDRTQQRAGLHRSLDPGDGEVYVWTSFEPDDARRVFACFDQPDLKARFAISVLAPSAWTVASNSPGEAVAEGDARRWRFADTVRLSTYLTVVCAGPFHEVRRSVDGYDLGWLARRSLASFLDEQAGELFALTAAGLRFFGEQFAMPFPQQQYTQVFCPDFQGAMENWGCVTWMDSFLFRSAPTLAEREMRAVILLHEMAHMWFGDIVTMRWWDDLWLNESFADWAAVWATARCTEFGDAWVSFLGGRKEAGYAADAAPSTHPIRQDVPTVEAAKAAFDMVTYAKGASVLRQLTAYAGEEAFVAGLREYFAAHAWGNATLDDLLAAVGASSGRDLHAWARQWLLQAGTDVLTSRADVDDAGAYREVDVEVSPPTAWPAARPHRLVVGVYDRAEAGLTLRERVELDVEGPATSVPELAGRPAADLLLLNDGDLTFARVRPEESSVRALLEAGETLPDPLARGISRLTLWHLVDDGLLAAPEVVGYLRRALLTETSAAAREGLLRTAVAAVLDWTAPARVAELGDALAGTLLDLAARAEEAGDATGRLSALQGAIAVARGAQRVAELERFANDSVDLRWRWLTTTAIAGALDDAALAALVEADPDPDAVHRAWVVRAARPQAEAKQEAWEALAVARRVPLQILPAAGRAFWEPTHSAVLAPFGDAFVEVLPDLGAAGMTAIMGTVASMFPRHGVDATYPQRLREAAAVPGLSPLVAGQVRERSATLDRMLRARALG
ncbi:MAG: aminopeptidase N [Kineosporiaceae bacterium]